jgi:hypothetical protein
MLSKPVYYTNSPCLCTSPCYPKNLMNPGWRLLWAACIEKKILLSKSFITFLSATATWKLSIKNFYLAKKKKTISLWIPREGIMWNLQSLLPGFPAAETHHNLGVHGNSIQVKKRKAVGKRVPFNQWLSFRKLTCIYDWSEFPSPSCISNVQKTLRLLPAIYHVREAFLEREEEKKEWETPTFT